MSFEWIWFNCSKYCPSHGTRIESSSTTGLQISVLRLQHSRATNTCAWTGDHVSSAFRTLYNTETYDIHENDRNLNYNGNWQTIAYLNTKVEALEREIEKMHIFIFILMSIFTQSFVNFLIKSLTEGFHTGINPLPTIPLES